MPAYSQVYTDIRDNLLARGYGHQNTGVNQTISGHIEAAVQELWNEEFWDFRREVVVGPAPLDLGDIGVIVKHVRLTNGNVLLQPTTESRHLDLSAGQQGSPTAYYIPDDVTLYLSPDSTDSVTAVVYGASPWIGAAGAKFMTVASGGTTCRIPIQYIDIVLILAEIRCMREDDRDDAADMLRQGPELAQRLSQMKDAMLTEQADAPKVLRPASLY